MLFQIADCIFNDIWGGTEIFSVLGSERFKSDPEPRPGGALRMRLALMLGGAASGGYPDPFSRLALRKQQHNCFTWEWVTGQQEVCASHKGKGESKGRQRSTWELVDGKSRTKAGGKMDKGRRGRGGAGLPTQFGE